MMPYIVQPEAVAISFLDFENDPNAMKAIRLPGMRHHLKGARFGILRTRDASNYCVHEIWYFGPMGLLYMKQTDNTHGFFGEFQFDTFKANQRNAVEFLGRAGREAKRLFLARLDQKILKTLRTCRHFSSKAYNWCLIDPVRRCAALDAYPALAHAFDNQHLEMAIALSGNLETALAVSLGHSNAVIRHIARLRPAFGDGTFKHNALMSAMDLIEPSYWPTSLRGLRQLYELHGNVTQISRYYSSGMTKRLLRDTVSARDVDWLSIDWAEFRPADADDAVRSFITTMLGPSLIAAAATGAIPAVRKDRLSNLIDGTHTVAHKTTLGIVRRAILGNSGLAKLVRFSADWHARTANFVGGGRKDLGDHELAHLVRDPVTIGDAIFKPLITQNALDHEHETMAHCIDTYGDSCAMGRMFAFHCLTPKHTFTMTLNYSQSEGLSFHSARGYQNERAAAFDDLAVQLLTYLKDAGARPSGGEEAREIVLRRSGARSWVENPEIPTRMAEEIFPRWMPLLPKRLRANSPTELVTGPFKDALSHLFSKPKTKLRRAA